MILATSYPALEIFWTILVFFAFVVWLMILFTVLSDIFRRHDTTGATKVAWMIAKAHELLSKGAINQAEFDQIKRQALAGSYSAAGAAGQ